MKLMVLKEDEQEPLKKWYEWIHDTKQKGERARLRRCSSLQEVISQNSFFRLSLPLQGYEKFSLDGLALIAGLLAWIKTPVETGLPEILGKGLDKPVLSELRFQRLLASDNPEEFFQSMRRAIIQGGEKANPVELADQIMHWYQQYKNPDWYQGQRQWQYRFAKPYYAQVN